MSYTFAARQEKSRAGYEGADSAAESDSNLFNTFVNWISLRSQSLSKLSVRPQFNQQSSLRFVLPIRSLKIRIRRAIQWFISYNFICYIVSFFVHGGRVLYSLSILIYDVLSFGMDCRRYFFCIRYLFDRNICLSNTCTITKSCTIFAIGLTFKQLRWWIKTFSEYLSLELETLYLIGILFGVQCDEII